MFVVLYTSYNDIKSYNHISRLHLNFLQVEKEAAGISVHFIKLLQISLDLLQQPYDVIHRVIYLSKLNQDLLQVTL